MGKQSKKSVVYNFFHGTELTGETYGNVRYVKNERQYKLWTLWHYSTVIALIDPINDKLYINPSKYSTSTSKLTNLIKEIYDKDWDGNLVNVSYDEFKQMCKDNQTPVES